MLVKLSSRQGIVKMGNKPSSTSSGPKPSKKKIRKFIERVSQRRSHNAEAERNKAKLASMRLNGLKPKREFYLAERVLTDTEISHIMVSQQSFQSRVVTSNLCMQFLHFQPNHTNF